MDKIERAVEHLVMRLVASLCVVGGFAMGKTSEWSFLLVIIFGLLLFILFDVIVLRRLASFQAN